MDFPIKIIGGGYFLLKNSFEGKIVKIQMSKVPNFKAKRNHHSSHGLPRQKL